MRELGWADESLRGLSCQGGESEGREEVEEREGGQAGAWLSQWEEFDST